MAAETYADATPDSKITADYAAITADQTLLVNERALEQATPGLTTHLQDQITLQVDDLVIEARQRAIDLTTSTYGASNSSDLTAAQAALTAAQQKKTNDQNLQ